MVTPDGQKYGPVDLPTLQQWSQEGRVVATSVLEEEGTGNRVNASDMPGLSFGAPTATMPGPAAPGPQSNPYTQQQPTNPYSQPGPQNPYQNQGANYYRGGGASDPAVQKDVNNAWIGGVIGLLCCGPVAIWGLTCANRAKAAGHPGANAAFIFNIVAVVIWVMLFIVRIGSLR